MRITGDGIKRRRKAWLRSYRKRGGSLHGKPWASWTRRFLFQSGISFLLLLFIIFSMHTPLPWSETVHSFLTQRFAEEFPFEVVKGWVERELGSSSLTLLPLLQKKEEETVTVFSLPLKGTIVEDFKSNGNGVILETGVRSPVHPIGTGWVRFVGKTKGLGKAIVIQHGDGKVSIYGYLGEIYVNTEDWVYPDMVIALVAEQSLYLSVREKDQAINPMDVIPFE
ncbi:peptidoglycan DD-metalloendopeptidase family protein [Thermicanus aegyptius]|uniref:peptidoglycan DD-metalloendopeptidase family protein n=1 Tax=Thermicanus aegyptius TaxID=94009 RepID=UPI000405FA29|nr:peptidoglycan DD-metalloendopeptidase family protein [Thermicanus aegyptius]